MHSSDEETARQTKRFTKDSTTVLQLLGKEKNSLTSDVFKTVSLERDIYVSRIR